MSEVAEFGTEVWLGTEYLNDKSRNVGCEDDGIKIFKSFCSLP